MGSGCDTVDTADASDTRERWFESSQWPLLLNNYLQSTACRKDEIKEKAAGNCPFKNKVFETNIWKWGIEQSETLKRKKKTPKRRRVVNNKSPSKIKKSPKNTWIVLLGKKDLFANNDLLKLDISRLNKFIKCERFDLNFLGDSNKSNYLNVRYC